MNRIREIWQSLFVRDRFFAAWGLVTFLVALGFAWPLVWRLGQVCLVILLLLTGWDAFLLWGRMVAIDITRSLPRLLSLGDDNPSTIVIRNRSGRAWRATVLDELPAAFQDRSAGTPVALAAKETRRVTRMLRPVTRGEYAFGQSHLFIRSSLGLLERRLTANTAVTIPVYPSVLQMKKYALLALPQHTRGNGLRKIRRIGHSYEFEQIKPYVSGDDRRAINWKATSRRQALMVNQFEDERSQAIYTVLDTGRTMGLAFDGMSLLDYAINASLVLANVALQRHDKAGLLAFDRGLVSALAAESRSRQRQRLLDALYRLQASGNEADWEGLYAAFRRLAPARSLVVLFTNFESDQALDRALPVLRRLARRHLLLLVLFENTEIARAAEEPAHDIPAIYQQTIAASFLLDKRRMALRAAQHGIQVVHTRPEDLSLDVLNKYIELKARGMI